MKQLKNKKIEYLWFFAPSGHGKTTAVTDCAQEKDHILRRRLGLKDRNVILCKESPDREHGKYDNLLPILISEYKKLKSDTSILIDGQWPDLELDTIYKLKAAIEDTDHKIVFLNCAPIEAARRCREEEDRGKADWEKNYGVAQAQTHLKNMVGNIEKLREVGFTVTVIDSSDYEYRLGKWENVKQLVANNLN